MIERMLGDYDFKQKLQLRRSGKLVSTRRTIALMQRYRLTGKVIRPAFRLLKARLGKPGLVGRLSENGQPPKAPR